MKDEFLPECCHWAKPESIQPLEAHRFYLSLVPSSTLLEKTKSLHARQYLWLPWTSAAQSSDSSGRKPKLCHEYITVQRLEYSFAVSGCAIEAHFNLASISHHATDYLPISSSESAMTMKARMKCDVSSRWQSNGLGNYSSTSRPRVNQGQVRGNTPEDEEGLGSDLQ